MSNKKMLVPTVQQVDKIVAKVRQIDRKIDEIHTEPVDPSYPGQIPAPIDDAVDSLYDDERGADYDWPPIEWFVRKLGGRDVPLDREPEDAEEAKAALILASGNTERIMRYVTERLWKLSYYKLCTLKNEELPPLFKDMLTGGDGVREQALLDLSTAIEKQIKECERLAEESCRRTYITPLINEVERMLLPIRNFIRAVTCCKPDENPLVVELVRRADHGALRDAIAELEKIKYGARIIEAKRQVGAAGKPKKRKPGRPRISDDRVEVERRRTRRDEWERSRDAGVLKSDFCRDKNIEVTDLDAALKYCRDHGI